MTRKKDVTLAKIISKNIKAFRLKLFPGHGGQGKCIDAFGADRNKWSKWENGKSTPTDPEQRKLAAFFGITLAELRGENAPAVVAGAVDVTSQVETFLELVADLAALGPSILAGTHQKEAKELMVMLRGEVQKYKDDVGITDTARGAG